MTTGSPQQLDPAGEERRWLEDEDRVWKQQRKRQGMLKNLLWLLAGIGLAVLLDRLGCLSLAPA